MTDAEIAALIKARAALARRRNAIAGGRADTNLASVKAAEDLTRVLLAIAAVDRTLVDAGRPYMPEPVITQPAAKGQTKPADQDNAQTSASARTVRARMSKPMSENAETAFGGGDPTSGRDDKRKDQP